jgi:hypothetical protein
LEKKCLLLNEKLTILIESKLKIKEKLKNERKKKKESKMFSDILATYKLIQDL